MPANMPNESTDNIEFYGPADFLSERTPDDLSIAGLRLIAHRSKANKLVLAARRRWNRAAREQALIVSGQVPAAGLDKT